MSSEEIRAALEANKTDVTRSVVRVNLTAFVIMALSLIGWTYEGTVYKKDLEKRVDINSSDRWKGAHQVEWAFECTMLNPGFKAPDVRAIQRSVNEQNEQTTR